MNVRKIFAASICILTLGCAESLYWVKPGSSQADFEQARIECKVLAINQVPERKTKIKLSNEFVSCVDNGFGKICTKHDANEIVEDENENLRTDYFQLCLKKLGWKQVAASEMRSLELSNKHQVDSAQSSQQASQRLLRGQAGQECKTRRDCNSGLSCNKYGRCYMTSIEDFEGRPIKQEVVLGDAKEGDSCKFSTDCQGSLACNLHGKCFNPNIEDFDGNRLN